MLALSLGGIVSAQTFDFNCVTPQGENTWSLLNTEFTDTQITSLTDDGYVGDEDRNGNQQMVQVFPDVSYTYTYPDQPNGDPGREFTFDTNAVVSVQTGSFYDGRDDSTGALGPFVYRVNIRGGTFNDVSFYNDVDEVLAFLLSIYRPAPDSDEDGDGFTHAEEEMLVDNSFVQHNELYQITVGVNGYIEISLVNGEWYLLYTVDSDFVSEGTYATLADALDAAALITN